MKKLLAFALGAAFLGGCRMKEFSATPFYEGNEVKFTGAAEDRVNLWPVAYWREPVGSVAWPLVSWGGDHFALRPLYSRYGKEYNFLWPLAQFDTGPNDNRVFPFYWGKDYRGRSYFSLFPVLWHNGAFDGVFPLFWSKDFDFCTVFPLFWADFTSGATRFNTLFPLYYCGNGGDKFWALCWLAGWERYDGAFTHHRFLPLYVWDRGDFYSLPFSRYRQDYEMKTRILMGFAGYNSNANDGAYASSWLFPLYYHDDAKFITPFFGTIDDSYWLFPLFYRDSDSFVTPLYSRMGDADWLFPLFYRDSESFVSLLFGKSGQTQWFLPFYICYRNGFASILFGYDKYGNGNTTAWFAMGLCGVKSGENGWWIFPLYSRRKSALYDERLAWLDADRLPDEIVVTDSVMTNIGQCYNNRSRKEWAVTNIFNRIGANPFKEHDLRTHLLLSDNDHTLSGHIWGGTDYHPDEGEKPCATYSMDYHHDIGNCLVFRSEHSRTADFNATTREKTKDSENTEASLFFFIYSYKYRADRLKGTSRTSYSVLWKLWDWKEENGDVSLDVFPFFTYDSKSGGYSKTSFLWRLFRYESDPAKGLAVDLLFIPIWR